MSQPSDSQLALDALLPFQLEESGLRGRILRLGGSIDTMLRQHAYPNPLAKLVAEMTALTAALGTSMKFDGVFTVQTKTDGAVRLLVADVTPDGALRACAQYDAAALEAATANAQSLVGQGHLVMTLDHKLGEERYQGVVHLDGDNLTEAFQLYFRQSEQIPTGLIVAAQQDEAGAWRAGCLMIQRMPKDGGRQAEPTFPSDTAREDDWLRAMALMQTCTADELTDPAVPLPDLLYRLFHEEGVRVFDALPLRHECRCSRERIAALLSGMSADEREAMRLEDGSIAVTCHFCSNTYKFEA